MSIYDYEDDTGLSAAELDLINEAEKGLSTAGVTVPEVDVDDDLVNLLNDEDEEQKEPSAKAVTQSPQGNETRLA